MTLIEWAVALCTAAIRSVIGWFTVVLDSCTAGEFYIAMVFICMACGFLLSNFGAIRSAGSDLADNTADAWARHSISGRRIVRGKFASGKWVRGNRLATGKYEKVR